MDGTRLKRICEKLGIKDIETMTQKQFDGLVANLNLLDRDTVRTVIERIPDLADKLGNYFHALQGNFQLSSGKDYLDAMRDQQQLLVAFLEREENPKTRDRIADELLNHSKWLREHSIKNDFFKKMAALIGMTAVCIFVRGLQQDIKQLAKRVDRRQDRELNHQNDDAYEPGRYEDERERERENERDPEYRYYESSPNAQKEYPDRGRNREYGMN